MRVYVYLISLFLYSSHAFALFCPNNFSSIDYGNTIQQVEQTCGQPSSVNTYQKTQATNQTWDYYIQAPGFNQNMAKMSLLFRDDELMNIHLHYNAATRAQICPLLSTKNKVPAITSFCFTSNNDENVSSTNICGGFIQVGNNAQAIKYVCGEPAAIKDVPGTQVQSTDITELHYSGGAQNVTLIFENGVLKDRQFQ